MIRFTPVVKNLLIINVVFFILQSMFGGFTEMVSLWKIGSQNFAPYQFFTYMFAHGGFGHILFNMLGLVFLGPMLENFWGPKKFLTFYLVTGIGAGLLYSGIEMVRMNSMETQVEEYVLAPGPDNFNIFMDKRIGQLSPQYAAWVYEFTTEFSKNPNDISLIQESKEAVKGLYRALLNGGSMLGASGAVYGIIMAFGLLFPNLELMLLFPPIPVKAKYLALVLGLIALYSGLQGNPGDNVAHFAHLGGMVFAFIMIKYWQSQGNKFY